MTRDRMIRSTWVVGGLTLASRILGLVRDKALVLVFGGTGGVLDAFLLAFTIPNLFRRLLGEGALGTAFIPVFIDYRENRSPAEANRFAGSVVTALCLVLLAVSVAGGVGCRLWGTAVGGETGLALRLTAVMLPFVIFICLSAILGGMLQSVRVFSVPAAMPILLNIAIVGSLAWAAWGIPDVPRERAVWWVAGAVLLAGFLQIVFQYPVLCAKGVYIFPNLDVRNEGMRRVLRSMAPTALGLALFQVNVLTDRLIAFVLVDAEGALTHLYLGNRLMQLPLALFGISMATTAFPELVGHASRGEHEALFEKMNRSIRFILFITVPAAVGLAVTAEPVVRMIFQEPDLSFSDADVYRTSLVLALYAPSLVFAGMQHVLTRVFYARDDYRTPVRVTAVMVGVNLLLNLLLVYAPDLWVRWTTGRTVPLGEGGLALSTSIVSVLTVSAMWNLLRRNFTEKDVKPAAWEKSFSDILPSAARIAAAAAATGYVAYTVGRSIPAEPELLVRIERGAAAVVMGVVGYAMMCVILAVPEFDEFLRGRRKDDADGSAGGGS